MQNGGSLPSLSWRGLVSVQKISRFERQFPGKLYNCHAAVDGVYVNDADCAGDRCDLVDEILVGFNDHDGRMVGTPVVRGCDQVLYLRFGQVVNLFEKYFH